MTERAGPDTVRSPFRGEAPPDMTGFTFVYFSAIDWRFRIQHHFIAREIARSGGRVLYVENSGVRWPHTRDSRRVYRRVKNILRTIRTGSSHAEPGIEVLPPRVLPIHPSWVVRRLNRMSLLRQLRAIAPDLDPSHTIAWITLPNWTSLDAAQGLRPQLTVYWNADEFARVPGAHPSIRASEAAVARSADLVFVTSERLERLMEREGKRPIRVPVLVNAASFSDAARGSLDRPQDLAGLPGRIIGYMGGINHKLDARLLEMVAAAFPRDSVVLLGGVEDPRYVPRREPNIFLLGSRPHAQLPAYLQHFDVCLIPYVRNAFTDSVFPAKLNEYLAAGRPVVSTALPELRPFSAVVQIAQSVSEFIEAVERTLDEPDRPELAEARIAMARRSSYDVVVPWVLGRVHAMLVTKGNRSAVR